MLTADGRLDRGRRTDIGGAALLEIGVVAVERRLADAVCRLTGDGDDGHDGEYGR